VFVGTKAGARKDAGGGGGGGEAKLGIPKTEKKFATLELSLLRLQQNVEIPGLFILLFNGLLSWWVFPSSDDDV
jgi:hypothetical protein